MFLTLYATGMRLGEMLGLQWNDLDFRRREMRLVRSLDDKTQEDGTPKSGHARTVDMADDLADVLKRLKVRRAEQALKYGWGEVPAWVFCDRERRPIRANRVRDVFARILKKAGLAGHFSPHCLRHTFACILLSEDGSLIQYVQQQLGHASITMTVDLYGKWLRPAHRAVNRLLVPASGSKRLNLTPSRERLDELEP